MKSLETLNWPVNQDDIESVKKEIELGEKYLKQSKDMRKFICNQNEATDADEKESNQEPKKNKKKRQILFEGNHVLARFDLNGYYYTGRLLEVFE
jgi:hypothetical protein